MGIEKLRVAIVHDWLTNSAGAEKVTLALSDIFPKAPIYTSVYNKEDMVQFKDRDVRASYLQNWPLAKTHHQFYPTMRELAFESFDFSGYDLVISVTSAEAKGIITSTETSHICYINTPTRYYWSHYDDYLSSPGFGIFDPIIRAYLSHSISKRRRWDYAAAQRPDQFVSNSITIQERVKKYYKRDSAVIYPPVDIKRFAKIKPLKGEYFLALSRLVPYKKTDLIVEAFNKLGLPLIVAGSGSQYTKLKAMANSNIKFVQNPDDGKVSKLYASCHALVFAAEEDFGIVPVEAMAAGKPVIAYAKGGAKETVVNKSTGIYFYEQTPQAIIDAVNGFVAENFDSQKIKHYTQKFSEENFKNQIKEVITQTMGRKNEKIFSS